MRCSRIRALVVIGALGCTVGTLLAACGSSTPTTRRPTTTPVADDEPAVQAPAPPLDSSLPSDAAVVGSVDLTAVLSHPLVGTFAGLIIPGLDLGRVLGLDPSRPTTFALESFDAEARAAIVRIGAHAAPIAPAAAPPAIPPGLPALVEADWRVLGSRFFHFRVVLPVASPATWHETVRPLITELGLRKRHRPPPGVDGVACDEVGIGCFAFSHDATNVVADFVMMYDVHDPGGREGAGERARRTILELTRIRNQSRGTGATPAPALAGAIGRVSWIPERVADTVFTLGMRNVLEAVSYGVDPAMRGVLLAQGVYEASMAPRLARDARGAYFERIEVSAEGTVLSPTFRMRASAGPSAPPVIATPAAPSVTMDGGYAVVDVANAWSAALTFPVTPHSGGHFDRAVDEAGGGGLFVALPHALAFLAHFVTVGGDGDVALPPGAAPHVERTVSVFPDAEADEASLRIGVLSASTTEATALCILARDPARCSRRERLRLGRVAPHEAAFVRVERVGDRFVVIAGEDRGVVGSAMLRAVPSTSLHARARVDIPPDLMRELGVRGPTPGLPRGFELALESDAGGWTVSATPTLAGTP